MKVTKFDRALVIVQQEIANGPLNLRKRCIDRIKTELNMSQSGASTYAHNATKEIEKQTGERIKNEPVRETKADNEHDVLDHCVHIPDPVGIPNENFWSAVTVKKGVAVYCSCSTDKQQIEEEAEIMGGTVVEGIQAVGMPIGCLE